MFKAFISDIISAIKAAKQGFKVGQDAVSTLTFAEDLVRISERPEGSQKQIEGVLEHTRKWRVTANVDKFTVLACNGDSKNPAEFTWKCGEE